MLESFITVRSLSAVFILITVLGNGNSQHPTSIFASALGSTQMGGSLGRMYLYGMSEMGGMYSNGFGRGMGTQTKNIKIIRRRIRPQEYHGSQQQSSLKVQRMSMMRNGQASVRQNTFGISAGNAQKSGYFSSRSEGSSNRNMVRNGGQRQTKSGQTSYSNRPGVSRGTQTNLQYPGGTVIYGTAQNPPTTHGQAPPVVVYQGTPVQTGTMYIPAPGGVVYSGTSGVPTTFGIPASGPVMVPNGVATGQTGTVQTNWGGGYAQGQISPGGLTIPGGYGSGQQMPLGGVQTTIPGGGYGSGGQQMPVGGVHTTIPGGGFDTSPQMPASGVQSNVPGVGSTTGQQIPTSGVHTGAGDIHTQKGENKDHKIGGGLDLHYSGNGGGNGHPHINSSRDGNSQIGTHVETHTGMIKSGEIEVPGNITATGGSISFDGGVRVNKTKEIIEDVRGGNVSIGGIKDIKLDGGMSKAGGSKVNSTLGSGVKIDLSGPVKGAKEIVGVPSGGLNISDSSSKIDLRGGELESGKTKIGVGGLGETNIGYNISGGLHGEKFGKTGGSGIGKAGQVDTGGMKGGLSGMTGSLGSIDVNAAKGSAGDLQGARKFSGDLEGGLSGMKGTRISGDAEAVKGSTGKIQGGLSDVMGTRGLGDADAVKVGTVELQGGLSGNIGSHVSGKAKGIGELGETKMGQDVSGGFQAKNVGISGVGWETSSPSISGNLSGGMGSRLG